MTEPSCKRMSLTYSRSDSQVDTYDSTCKEKPDVIGES
jgi:hypothetical protein